MFATSTRKLKQILEKRNELVLAFAVCQKEWEEDREVAGPYKDFFGDLLSKVFGADCILGQIVERCASEWHQLLLIAVDITIIRQNQINRLPNKL